MSVPQIHVLPGLREGHTFGLILVPLGIGHGGYGGKQEHACLRDVSQSVHTVESRPDPCLVIVSIPAVEC